MFYIRYTLSTPEIYLGKPRDKYLRLKTLLETIYKERPIGFNALLAKRIVSKRLLAKYLDQLEEAGLIQKDGTGRYVMTALGLTRMAVPDLENLDLKLERTVAPFEPMPNYHYIGIGDIMSSYPTPIKFDIIRSMTKEEKASLEYWTNFLQHEDFLPAETAYNESAKGFAYFAREYFNNVFHERILTLARQSNDGYKAFSLENILAEPMVLILSYKPSINEKEKEKSRHAIAGFYLMSLLNIHTADDDIVVREMTKGKILDEEEGEQVLDWLGFIYERVGKKKEIISKSSTSSSWELRKHEVYSLALRHLALANLIDNKLKLFLVVPELICLCQRAKESKGFIALDLPEVMSVMAGINDRHIMNEEWMVASTDVMRYQDIIVKCNDRYGMSKEIVDQQLEILESWAILRREDMKLASITVTKFKLDIVSGYPLVASDVELISYVEDLIKAFKKHKKLTLQRAEKIVESAPRRPHIMEL